jgi:diguanylate cyclase (GGDEF)-like protein
MFDQGIPAERILVADDDMGSRRILELELARCQYQVVLARDGNEAWGHLQGPGAARLAILDWKMPGLEGPEICRLLRRRGPEPYTYVILASAKGATEDVVEGFAAGADDYLIKPIHPAELEARLTAGRRILGLERRLVEARDAQSGGLGRAPLPAAWDREAMLEALTRELAGADRESTPLAVMLLDIDHFKRIKERYGRWAGDAVLTELVSRMQASIRPYDVLGRYGGDAFLMLAPGAAAEQALTIADRLRRAVDERPVILPEGAVTVTVSIGVSVSNPSSTTHPDRLIQAAEAALGQAKREGRNRVVSSERKGPAWCSIDVPSEAAHEPTR